MELDTALVVMEIISISTILFQFQFMTNIENNLLLKEIMKLNAVVLNKSRLFYVDDFIVLLV